MAIEVKISRGYAWRMIIIAVVCLVFGLWGVYDYVVAIPREQLRHERLDRRARRRGPFPERRSRSARR